MFALMRLQHIPGCMLMHVCAELLPHYHDLDIRVSGVVQLKCCPILFNNQIDYRRELFELSPEFHQRIARLAAELSAARGLLEPALEAAIRVTSKEWLPTGIPEDGHTFILGRFQEVWKFFLGDEPGCQEGRTDQQHAPSAEARPSRAASPRPPAPNSGSS